VPTFPAECLRYETLIAGASAADISSFRMRASQVLPGQLASLIYTSGTTGEPKGVMLTHTNFCSNVTDVGHDFQLDPAEDVALSFLPLAHVYGRTLDYIYIFQGAALAYVESIDAVAQALLEVRPTITAAVPRFFEKIYARLVEQGSKNTGVKRMLFDWAMNVAQRATPWRATGAPASLALKAQWKLADAPGLQENSSPYGRPSAHRFFRRRASFPNRSRNSSGPWVSRSIRVTV